jgi:hypothetical protein
MTDLSKTVRTASDCPNGAPHPPHANPVYSCPGVVEPPNSPHQDLMHLFDEQHVGAAIPPDLLGAYRRTLADAVLKIVGTW